MKKPKKIKKVDMTPASASVEELKALQTALLGNPYKDTLVEGTITKLTIVGSRLIAEVTIKPNVILG